jgi:acyl-CoA thioesterase-2
VSRASLVDMLSLDRIDRDLFRAPVRDDQQRFHLFGGQVCAQALMAAIRTVDDRAPHSLHGYFLRRGNPAMDVLLHVDRDRDGGSFSARRVEAVQDGEVIFSLSASFHAEEESGEFQVQAPAEVPPPDTFDQAVYGGGPPDHFETRLVVMSTEETAGGMAVPQRLWARAREPLPDDPAMHACGVAYLSDYGSGFATTTVPNLAVAGPSLDHVMWFHQPIRVDDWVLIDMWPVRASGGRGTYMGTVHDGVGTLGGVFAQEALLRPGMRRGPVPGKS